MTATSNNHLEAWLTTAEVAARLGVSESTLDREVRAGRWQTRYRPREGRKPERVFAPHEVEAREPKPVTEVVRHEPVNASNSVSLTKSPESTPSLAFPDPTPAILRFAALVAPAKPRWLTLDQASEYTGLSRPFLVRLIRAGQLPAIRDRAIKVREADLDNIGNSVSLTELRKCGQRVPGGAE